MGRKAFLFFGVPIVFGEKFLDHEEQMLRADGALRAKSSLEAFVSKVVATS